MIRGGEGKTKAVKPNKKKVEGKLRSSLISSTNAVRHMRTIVTYSPAKTHRYV